MRLSKLKVLTSIILTATLVLSLVFPHISANASSYSNIGEEVIDEVVENVIADDQAIEEFADEIYRDLEMIDSLGLNIEQIVNATVNADEMIQYDLELTDTITDTITVEKRDDAIIMNAVEGENENELIIQDDGAIYLDGKRIVIEEDEENLECKDDLDYENSSNINITQSTGGWYWYESGKAPDLAKKASYKSYPTSPTSKCANLALHEAIKSIAIGVLVSILVNYLTGGSGAITLAGTGKDTLAGILTGFVSYDPTTKNLSAKYFVAKSKNNNRCRKKKCYIYSKKNYKGKQSTTIEYGVMM